MATHLTVQEYGCLQTDGLSEGARESLRHIAAGVDDPASQPCLLGLHLEPPNACPRAYWFVGQVWLKLGNDRVVFRVNPKVNISAFQMYVECVCNPFVRTHLDDCIKIFWPEMPIPVDDRKHPITLLVVMRYLGLLYDLCQKHLRVMITPSEANFVGKIRGRPVLQATIRANLAKARLDRTYCRFPAQSIDTVPNQILAAALHQATKYLRQTSLRDDRLFALTNFSISALSDVTLRRILPTDFRGLHYGGLLRPYREPHQWASLVLRLLGPDPLNEIEAEKRARDLPPFAIDMNELFERYCEVALRKVSNQQVWAGYKDKDRNLGPAFMVRPDFLVTANDATWIVDAKYKENWDWKEHKADVFQIVTYSRHREVLKHLGLNPDF